MCVEKVEGGWGSYEAVLISCYHLMMFTSGLRLILMSIPQLCGPEFIVLGGPQDSYLSLLHV